MQESQCVGGTTEKMWGGQYHQQDRVYLMGDIALCIPSQIPGGSYYYMIIKNTNNSDEAHVKQIGNVQEGKWDNPSVGRVYDREGLCPTLNSMAGGSREPMFVDAVVMRGRDKNNPSFRGKSNENFEQRLEINPEGIANSLTTVQKDNMVLIRQATKDGLIPCKIGGGGKFGISRLTDQTRTSNRERRCLPDSDNGEYP